MAIPRISLINFSDPNDGPRGAVYETIAGAGPLQFEFRQRDLDGEQFIPSGIYNGTDAEIKVVIRELYGYNFTVAPGDGKMYPAPRDQTVDVFGAGAGAIVFVNYPIIQG